MPQASEVLFALTHRIGPMAFEELCVDLLHREGYSRIIPGGRTRDLGRDAEVRYWTGNKVSLAKIAFQFSMEQNWEKKLRRDIEKILRNAQSVQQIVFVSNRNITVEKRDKLCAEYLEKNQITIEFFDQGWLKIKLEQESLDLADTYLGIKIAPQPAFYAMRLTMNGLNDSNWKELLEGTTAEKVRATLLAQIEVDPYNLKVLKGLADIEYFLLEYDNCILTVEKAMEITSSEYEQINLLARKATALAERGIREKSIVSLKEAQPLLKNLVDKLGRSIDHYNFGNVLEALGLQDLAEFHYRKSLDLDDQYPPCWKNLGTLLHKSGRIDEALESIEKALLLDPSLVEALCSKASILIMEKDAPRDAVAIFKEAFTKNPNLDIKWPYGLYWYAIALCQIEQFEEALETSLRGQKRNRDCGHYDRLISDIYSKLWPQNSVYRQPAERYFFMRISKHSRNYHALGDYIKILCIDGRQEELWTILSEFFSLQEINVKEIFGTAHISLEQFATALELIKEYLIFRDDNKIRDYEILLQQYQLSPHKESKDLLSALLAVPFTDYCTFLEKSESCIEEQKLSYSENHLAKKIIYIFAALSPWLFSKTRPTNIDDFSDWFSKGLLWSKDVVVAELARQVGHIRGVKGMEVEDSLHDKLVNFVHGKDEILTESLMQNIWSV